MGAVTTPIGGGGNDGWEVVKENGTSLANNGYTLYMSGFTTISDVSTFLTEMQNQGYISLKFRWVTSYSSGVIRAIAISNEILISDWMLFVESGSNATEMGTGAGYRTVNSVMDSYFAKEVITGGVVRLKVENAPALGGVSGASINYRIYARK